MYFYDIFACVTRAIACLSVISIVGDDNKSLQFDSTQKVKKNISSFSLAAATIKFNGVNSLSLRYPAGLTNEADDITIRFRTIEQSGLLLTTRHDRSQDKLELSLESARVRVTLQVID